MALFLISKHNSMAARSPRSAVGSWCHKALAWESSNVIRAYLKYRRKARFHASMRYRSPRGGENSTKDLCLFSRVDLDLHPGS